MLRVPIPDTTPVGVGADPGSREGSVTRVNLAGTSYPSVPSRPPQQNTFLSKLRMREAIPFLWIGIGNYANVAGTRRVLVETAQMPAGTALVVTQITPRFWVSNESEIVEISNPWAMVYNVANAAAPHKFDIKVSNGYIGEIVTRFNDGTNIIDQTGILPAKSLTDMLDWRGAMYTAIVSGGGSLVVTSLILQAISTTIGATIPDAVGIEIGGFKIPVNILNEALRL